MNNSHSRHWTNYLNSSCHCQWVDGPLIDNDSPQVRRMRDSSPFLAGRIRYTGMPRSANRLHASCGFCQTSSPLRKSFHASSHWHCILCDARLGPQFHRGFRSRSWTNPRKGPYTSFEADQREVHSAGHDVRRCRWRDSSYSVLVELLVDMTWHWVWPYLWSRSDWSSRNGAVASRVCQPLECSTRGAQSCYRWHVHCLCAAAHYWKLVVPVHALLKQNDDDSEWRPTPSLNYDNENSVPAGINNICIY